MTPTSRQLLRAIGIGQFNATIIINQLFFMPATTDPRSAPIILLVKHLQMMMNKCGANLQVTGYLDNATANAIESIAGPGWEQRTWADLVQAVLLAKNKGITWREDPPPPPNYGPSLMKLGSFGPLPDVPGGLVTYGIAGLVAWHFWNKRTKR